MMCVHGLPNGKVIVYNGSIYYGHNNIPTLVETDVDLSQYITIDTLNSRLTNYITNSELNSTLTEYVQSDDMTTEINNVISTLDIPTYGFVSNTSSSGLLSVNLGFKPQLVFYTVAESLTNSMYLYQVIFDTEAYCIHQSTNGVVTLAASHTTSNGFVASIRSGGSVF